LLAISLIVFSANLHPTEEPRISRQKFTVSSGNLYDAISKNYNRPLANKKTKNKAAGTLILSKTKIKNNDAKISKIRFR